MFFLLSGYGLAAAAAARRVSLAAFYRDRLAKLYLTYWLIAGLFIAVGVLSGLRPLSAAFASRPLFHLGLQLLGLDQYLGGGAGYNATWWFMGVIISLYLLFPPLNALTRRFGWWSLLPSALLFLDDGLRVPVIQRWLLPFCLGILAAQRGSLPLLSARLAPLGRLRLPLLLALLAGTAAARQALFENGLRADILFAALVVLLCFETTAEAPALGRLLAYLGRHLFNIFLFHTFVYAYFWPRVVYAPGNPVAIMALLLGVCLAVSEAIEWLKSAIGLPRLLAAIRRIPVPASPLV